MGIIIENVSRSYDGKKVLDDISLEIKNGEFVSFLAPTGEGKTTLLRLIAGVERPDSGRIYYDGQDVTNLPVQKRSIGMVYQWFINYPSMNVFENIASPLRVSKKKISEKESARRVRETAELLKIDRILNHLPSEISGGQQQRLAIARALAKGTDYIFLDEPLTNLDYKLQEELRAELTDQGDYPEFCDLSEDELRAYVGVDKPATSFSEDGLLEWSNVDGTLVTDHHMRKYGTPHPQL